MNRLLPKERFSDIVKHAPLISMDLIVESPEGKILLGLRANRPAQGYWFVPGGCILKNERMSQAFKRLTIMELGEPFDLAEARFIGPYEHLYSDNFTGDAFGTHYIVLSYKIHLNKSLEQLPKEQHTDYRWFTKEEILENRQVHPNTKAYFEPKASDGDL